MVLVSFSLSPEDGEQGRRCGEGFIRGTLLLRVGLRRDGDDEREEDEEVTRDKQNRWDGVEWNE